MFSIIARLKQIATVVLFLLLPLTSMAAQEAQVKTVLIGFSGPLSGVSETFGKSLANAAEMALAETNRQSPRIGGQRVFYRLLRQDDRNDPQTAVAVAKYFLQEGVVAVIGTANSGTAQAVAKIYADAGVALVTPAVSASVLTEQGFGSFFRMIGHDDLAAANLLHYAIRVMNLRRFAVVDNGSLYGVAVSASVHEQVRQLGAQTVARERISYSTDLHQLVRRLKQRGAEAVFFGGYSSQAMLLAQVIQQEGGGLRLMVASMGAAGSTFLIAARSAANGVLAIESGVPTSFMPGWRRFEDDYNQRYGLNLYGLTPFAYDAAQVLMAAMRQCGCTRPRMIVETLRQIVIKGLTGPVAFDAAGNPRNQVFTIYQAQNQRWVPLQTYEDNPAPMRKRGESGESGDDAVAGRDARQP
ncbi:branched-chain amino acid ABC transporter substrate-binding protein [Herbaspirillum sp. LeCh32-8]|uniref:branched-chain amino acid ABC transporter substrate-binding protein n=1 Tax=Herbaspirillum sp. LeCh32-8 TaxID=2821356 RepID=UPI001AE5B7BA|nr:branched-chain amino acid ABC transporter substrate-binding protein [Herbaspirillum sp. LeCh32-8]MBP0598269.1 branched-chain amino acid ABC transporter substrate-binding protein [Herbaspirillum sp. LeCh32-8]